MRGLICSRLSLYHRIDPGIKLRCLYFIVLLQNILLLRLFISYRDLYAVSNASIRDTFWHAHYRQTKLIPRRMKPVSLRNDSVLVMACGRNVERALPNFRDNTYQILQFFKSYRILLGESDSSDQTLSYMQAWAQADDRVQLYTYGNLIDTYSIYRTARIAFCRNDLLSRARHHRWIDEAKYLLVMDIDINAHQILSADTFISNFEYDPGEWAVMTASQSITYYDIWALRTDIVDYDCWELVESFKHREIASEKYIKVHTKPIPIDFDLIPVRSAFGGFGVYQTKYLKNCRYQGMGERAQEVCEHVAFHQCINENGGHIFINPRFQNSDGLNV